MSITAHAVPLAFWRRNSRSVIPSQILGSGTAQFLALLAFAVLIRCTAWGEWNFDIDEQFYALVGDRLAHGDLLYVDIWDRKGPALYLTFALFSLFPSPILATQIAATLSAALGAYLVNRIAWLIATPKAAMLSGLAYCALLDRFEGDDVRAGVFFNTLVIAGAWLFLTRIDRLRQGRIDGPLVLGFLCLGLGIAYKQTVVFEGVAFGLMAIAMLWRAGCPLLSIAWQAGSLALAGAAPMLATGAYYWANGHFPELWNAMVTSNLMRDYSDPWDRAVRIGAMVGNLGLPLALASIGLYSSRTSEKRNEVAVLFVFFWALVSLTVLFTFPTMHLHYALPVLPPLSILCALYAANRSRAWPGFAALIGVCLVYSGPFHLADRWRARPAAQALVDYVKAETPDDRLFVWGAPSYLYTLLGAKPPSVLAFAPHMYEAREWSGYDKTAELRKILAGRPRTVVVQRPLPASPVDPMTVALVEDYVQGCSRLRSFIVYDHDGPQRQVVYSGCGDVARADTDGGAKRAGIG